LGGKEKKIDVDVWGKVGWCEKGNFICWADAGPKEEEEHDHSHPNGRKSQGIKKS